MVSSLRRISTYCTFPVVGRRPLLKETTQAPDSGRSAELFVRPNSILLLLASFLILFTACFLSLRYCSGCQDKSLAPAMAAADPPAGLMDIARYAHHVRQSAARTNNCSTLSQDDIPFKLRCAICNNLAVNAFRLPCCDQSVCETCTWRRLIL